MACRAYNFLNKIDVDIIQCGCVVGGFCILYLLSIVCFSMFMRRIFWLIVGKEFWSEFLNLCSALVKYLGWIGRHAQRCNPIWEWCVCTKKLPNLWKWCTWRKGLVGDGRRLDVSHIWLQSCRQRGWKLSRAFYVSRGLECVGLDDNRTCLGVW